MTKPLKIFIGIIVVTILAGVIALPESLVIPNPFKPGETLQLGSPRFAVPGSNGSRIVSFTFKRGLDIRGGMQIVLDADMNSIAEEDRLEALESVKEVLTRRVDLYGIAEPVVQTAVGGGNYRVSVELPGVTDPDQALALVGQTAKLDFQLLSLLPPQEDGQQLSQLTPTGLDGSMLERSAVQFDPTTGKPVVGLTFTAEGGELFGKITEENSGELLAVILDEAILMTPRINEPIYGGQAVIQGDYTLDQVKQLSIQLNAGALPVPIQVLEQRTIGASLGSESVQQSLFAGLVGLTAVIIFMTVLYGVSGVLASFALAIYALLTIAVYKTLGITVTVPGIAGLLLSIGMAVDANILIFERMKEEQRLGKPFQTAMELGFGRAWDSIKDANIATIITALVLINPLNFTFLNTSGLVRGFGITLLIGVLLGLFTGVIVTRTLLRLFLQDTQAQKVQRS